MCRPGARLLDAEACLALVLHYLSSAAQELFLQPVFGTTAAVATRLLRYGMRLLVRALADVPDARIMWPSPARCPQLADAVARKYPLLNGAFGLHFVDGLRLPIATSSDPQTENAFHNGWTCQHNVGNLSFVFGSDGAILRRN